MKLKIDIDCDNAAFDEDYRAEAAKLLYLLANSLLTWACLGSIPIIDSNGNKVGEARAEY